jgi:Domain of unknown function (DUF4190)
MKQNRLASWALAGSVALIPVGVVMAYGIGLLLSPIPIILGFVALRQINASGERGRVMAILGIAIGTVYLVIGLVLLAVALWLDVTDPLTIRE